MTPLLLFLALASTPEAQRGRELFAVHCERCHGARGEGDGPASVFLDPAPANLAKGEFHYRSTPSGCAPTDADLFQRLTLGVPGTAMPPFPSLPPRDRWALVAYIREIAAHRPSCAVVSPPSPPPPDDPEQGRAVYQRLGCASCHGDDARGAPLAGPKNALGQQVWTSDLTQPDALHGGSRATDMYLRITTGIDGTAMPSYAEDATDAERWQLVQYLLALRNPDRHEASEPRGRRLLLALGCAFCHSGLTAAGDYDPRRRFGGGQVVEVRPLAAYAPGNLTSTALARWSDPELIAAIKDGDARGKKLDPLAMPWPYHHALSAVDATALVAALRALPPVEEQRVRPHQRALMDRLRAKWNLLRGRPQPLQLVVRPAATDERVP